MNQETLSVKEAQRLIYASQKLIGPALEPVQIIKQLGYLQIDAISVVERAHHHTLWARNSQYRPSEIERLVSLRKIFEYWSHAAAYLPISDYRFSLPMKKEFKQKDSSWYPKDKKLMSAVLKRIRHEGPLKSKDFKNTKKSKNSSWWDWKPAKQALQRLFMEGRLEITSREGFLKIYDLTENVIPSSVNTIMPTKREYAKYLIRQTLRSYGLACIEEIIYIRNSTIKNNIISALTEMKEQGEVTQVLIEGIETPYFSFSNALDNLPRMTSKILILSPFDNLVIQRKRLNTLFNFDYKIECYVPVKKRKHGYFSLPVFIGATPLARIDCKADRANQILYINSVSCEKNINPKILIDKIQTKLKSYAKFNQCKTVSICKY